MLDRHGPDLDSWPAADADLARALLASSLPARSWFDKARAMETGIAASQPRIDHWRAQRVVRGALAEIAAREAHPSVWDRFRSVLVAPLPRAAFATVFAIIGFAIGLLVGTPAGNPHAGNDVPMMTANAEDVLY
jgi:hypothetical protein